MASEAQTREIPNDLATLLIPVSGNQYLLLPGVTVAEVIHYEEPQPVEGTPEWFLGTIEWRTKTIPLIAYETLSEQPCERGPNIHIAVLNGSEDADAMPFYAILTQATPRLLRLIKEEVIEDKHVKVGKLDIMAVKASGEPALIPDISKIEKEVLKQLK
ncbi:MAG TPA: chemotaxis protein CheW [Pseudomonadales bacterium]|jgi:chemosensory pili system protein ChpC